MSNFEPIHARYVNIENDEETYRIFIEESGEGIPLLCLHTAGADSRQYRHLMNDSEITDRFKVIAFDMPFHGKSNPPEKWWLKKYKLTTDFYSSIIRNVWNTLQLDAPIIMGMSMGGAIVLKLASDYQDELTGVIGLESAAFAEGRDNSFLHHPAIHGSELAACYTYGLNGPNSIESGRRENWWYYSQGGPGIYKGDIHFYCNDWDGRECIKKIDTKKCKVSLLTGEYDYSATPEMTKKVAEVIEGVRFIVMEDMGHFPTTENYPVFKKYLIEELDFMIS
ncbi:MAG: alpha/beta hydrolase [Nitrospinota bacterium]|nr:alpha/beta hydrolase [Nitrospinota bacterium]